MSHEASSSSTSQNAQGSTWTEPPWSGWIETTGDALLILEAARRGLIPRVTRRLVDSERKMITSGSVFVFDEDESGIKRWTDGFFWSPSRILGNFLLYRETEKRGAGHRTARSDQHVEEEKPHPVLDNIKLEGQSLSRSKDETSRLGIDRQRERSLVGSLTNSYKFKPGGMMKKTFSLTIGGVAQHLISYYKVEDVEQGRLRSPSSLPELASLDISPEYLDKTHFRNPPKVEIGVDGVPRYRGEADDIDGSPQLMSTPLPPMSPYPDDATHASSSKRNKQRYDPYAPKRTRKPKNSTHSPQEAPSDPPPSSSYGATTSSSSSSYPDPSLSATTTTPQYPTYSYYPVSVHPGYQYPAPAAAYPTSQYTSSTVPPISTSPHLSQHSPTSAEHTPTSATVPHSPYGGGGGYASEGSQSSQQQAVVYPAYYPSAGYSSYSTSWSQYSSYPSHHHAHSQSSGVSSGGGAHDDRDNGEGSPGEP